MNNETTSPAFLRPRNRRLISQDDEAASIKPINAPLNPPRLEVSLSSASSRAVSPVPSKDASFPIQPNRNAHRQQTRVRNSANPGIQGSQASPSKIAAGLWETSWSSLQGIATNLLSGDTFGSSSRSQSTIRQRRRPLEVAQSSKNAGLAQWGPAGSGEKQLGRGSREDRFAQVQAKKRETLLIANGFLTPDMSRRHKRRDSEERNATSAPPSEHSERDALVYVHRVKSSDTLAGVMIKYNCQPNVFRKANRLWPNDSIQVKTTVVLPVDACGVKGRKVPGPESSSRILRNENSEDSMRTPTNTQHPWGSSADSSETKETPLSSIPTSPSMSASNPEEAPWKHDSWVMIDGFPDVVEIARLSRSSLGFFPPRRRKSVPYSDRNTPSGSLEISQEHHQGRSPSRKGSRSSSGSHFVHQLQGPGGVGTLGREVRNPGPAPDGLNKLFPNVAPRTSFESVASTSSTGIENVGGAIEGWVRKIATRTAARVHSPARGGGRSGIGDLIELTDAFEPGEEDVEDGGGGVAMSRQNQSQNSSLEPAFREWQDDQERLLREHFPPRGRMFGESTSRRKGG